MAQQGGFLLVIIRNAYLEPLITGCMCLNSEKFNQGKYLLDCFFRPKDIKLFHILQEVFIINNIV